MLKDSYLEKYYLYMAIKAFIYEHRSYFEIYELAYCWYLKLSQLFYNEDTSNQQLSLP